MESVATAEAQMSEIGNRKRGLSHDESNPTKRYRKDVNAANELGGSDIADAKSAVVPSIGVHETLLNGLGSGDLDYSSDCNDEGQREQNGAADVFMEPVDTKTPHRAEAVILPSSQPSEDPIGSSQPFHSQATTHVAIEPSGFATAAGASLPPVSEAAKQQAAQLFSEPYAEEPNNIDSTTAFSTTARLTSDVPKRSLLMTAGGSALPPVSDATRAQAEAMFADSTAMPAPPVGLPHAFMTASGKPLSPPSTETKAQVDAIWARPVGEPSLGIASSPSRQMQAGTSFASPRKVASVASDDEYDVFADDDLVAAAMEDDFSAVEAVPQVIPAVVTFASAGKKPLKRPGALALQKAHKIIEEVELEIESLPLAGDVPPASKVLAAGASEMTDTEAFAAEAPALPVDLPVLASAVPTPGQTQIHRAFETPARRVAGRPSAFTTPRPAAFASPLPTRLATPNGANQSPIRLPLSVTTNITQRPPMTPLAGSKTPFKPQSSYQTPARRVGLGITPRAKKGPRGSSSFSVPFLKSGAAPATPVQSPAMLRAAAAKPVPVFVPPTPVFDLQPIGPRHDMKQSRLQPHHHSKAEMTERGLPSELCQVDVSNAEFYAFQVDGVSQTPTTTYDLLVRSGCTLVSLPWVVNHWRLILWKLAGQVRALPDLLAEKWSWGEVVNQLKYRYEREYNNAHRSCIKRIQERDAAAGMPMTLCVSAIEHGDDESEDAALPVLELTDGWYRIKAGTDPALRDAVKRGALKVGYKVAISGARLDTNGEGRDVLEALNKSHLIISGNSTSLARWDVKLGRSEKPYVATIRSLTPHGGIVPLMDVRISRVFPLAFVDGAKGSTTGPWSADEEATLQDQWERRFHDESARLQAELNTRLEKLGELVQNLSLAASEIHLATTDEASADLETRFEALLDANNFHAAVSHLSNADAAHMAAYGRSYLENEQVSGADDIQRELKGLCPPRNVRNFRIVRFDDANDYIRRSKDRTAQLSVWDAQALGDELIKQGNRYLISNLVPGQLSSWTPTSAKSSAGEIYLHTRRDTRWQLIE